MHRHRNENSHWTPNGQQPLIGNNRGGRKREEEEGEAVQITHGCNGRDMAGPSAPPLQTQPQLLQQDLISSPLPFLAFEMDISFSEGFPLLPRIQNLEFGS